MAACAKDSISDSGNKENGTPAHGGIKVSFKAEILQYGQDYKAGTTNIARCPLVGFLHKKEGSESEYVATMKADYALLCLHNNCGHDCSFVVTIKDMFGDVKYRKEIGSQFDINTMTSSVWQGTTEILYESQTTEIKNGEKAYLIIPASQASEEVCITSVTDGKAPFLWSR